MRNSRILSLVKTVIENPEFQKQADKIWNENERLAFIVWIAVNPNAGDIIQGSRGRRKIRWGMKGKGKRGGVRIIYFNSDKDRLILEYIYKKSDIENLKL